MDYTIVPTFRVEMRGDEAEILAFREDLRREVIHPADRFQFGHVKNKETGEDYWYYQGSFSESNKVKIEKIIADQNIPERISLPRARRVLRDRALARQRDVVLRAESFHDTLISGWGWTPPVPLRDAGGPL